MTNAFTTQMRSGQSAVHILAPRQNLPTPEDRMVYVGKITDMLNDLMANRRAYIEGELQKIRGWLYA